MAEVYRKVKGRKVSEIIARSRDAQRGLRDEVFQRALRAEAVLREHRNEGHSRIVMEHESIDWLVALDDTRGLSAAMSIEKGRRRYTIGPRTEDVPAHGKDRLGREVGHMEGVRPLGIAFGLPDDREVF